MSAAVSDYDRSAYPDEEALKTSLREDAAAILMRCFQDWPEGSSVVRGIAKGLLPEKLNAELARRGITAETEVISFALTEESEQLYKQMLEYRHKIAQEGPFGWDHGCFKNDCVGWPNAGPMPMPTGTSVGAPEAQTGTGDKFCRNCGEKRPENARFCPNCGEKYK